MLISIIIPVYNVENFLAKCLDSIINQSYKNLEIVLINDGSTDNSGYICDEYAKRDKRIGVLHKKNGGVSSARNAGLNIANGRYIGFVDPDDFVESGMFENLYKLAIDYKADISMCGYSKENIDGTVLYSTGESRIIEFTKEESLNTILNKDSFKGFLCNKLFSVDLFKQNPVVFFDENIHFCEDLLSTIQCILRSRNIVYDTYPYYHYIIHNDNACKSNYSEKKLTCLDALVKIIDLLKDVENIDLDRYKNYFMHMNISLLMHGINEKKCKVNDYIKLKQNLYRYKIKHLRDRSVKFACIVSRINVKLFYFIWRII